MAHRKSILTLLLTSTALMGSLPALGAELTVSAAASLTNAFKAVATAFEKQHPDTKVILNFAASDVLLQQIIQGAPVDVFASADQIAMDRAVNAQAVSAKSRKDFAANQIVLIVPSDDAGAIKTLADLKQPDVKRIAYGNPSSVPVGRYTQAALERDGLWEVVSGKGVPAQNVRQSLDYVARGEVDAGFVFATDAAIMPDKVKVAVRVPAVSPVTYPIALTSRQGVAPAAPAFIEFVLSKEGQAILGTFGFEKP